MAKRGGLPQMGKDGDFNGSGMQDESTDPPVRATAAQMAARKIPTANELKRGQNAVQEARGLRAVSRPVGANSTSGFTMMAGPSNPSQSPQPRAAVPKLPTANSAMGFNMSGLSTKPALPKYTFSATSPSTNHAPSPASAPSPGIIGLINASQAQHIPKALPKNIASISQQAPIGTDYIATSSSAQPAGWQGASPILSALPTAATVQHANSAPFPVARTPLAAFLSAVPSFTGSAGASVNALGQGGAIAINSGSGAAAGSDDSEMDGIDDDMDCSPDRATDKLDRRVSENHVVFRLVQAEWQRHMAGPSFKEHNSQQRASLRDQKHQIAFHKLQAKLEHHMAAPPLASNQNSVLTSDDRIAKPKGRGFGRSNAQSPAPPVFNQISGNAGQTNGTGISFGAQAQGAGFNMSMPMSNAGQNGTGINGVNPGFSGALFNLPGNTSQNQPASSSPSTIFDSQPSSFNFGGQNTQQQSSTGFTFGQQPQSNGTTNGRTNDQSQQPSNMFGASRTAPAQGSFGGFSTPAAKQNDNPFGLGTQAAAPQTAPNPFGGASQNASQPFSFGAPQATPSQSSNVFGASQTTSSQPSFTFGATSKPQQETPSQQPSFTFGASSTKPSSSAASFGAPQRSAQQSSPAHHSMMSPPRQQEAPKSIFDTTSSSAPTSTPSLFSGFGQSTANDAIPPATSATPAASISAPFGGFGTADKADTPAAGTSKPASLFSPTPSTNVEASVFGSLPKATFSSNLFSTPAPAATPAQASTSNMFSQAKPQEASSMFSSSKPTETASNLFSSMKPAETAPTTQATKPTASLFAPISSTPASKSTSGFDFSAKSTEPSAPSTQEQSEDVSTFNAPATSMSTLNSAASPATLTRTKEPGELTFDVPPAPAHYTENERQQWYWFMQLICLDKAVSAILRRPDSINTDRQHLYTYAAREAGRMQAELRVHFVSATQAHEAEPTPTPVSLGPQPQTSSNPFASNNESTMPKPATTFASSTSTNLFASSNNAFSAASNKRKSDSVFDREREDGSQDSSKKSRTGEADTSSGEVKYPELTAGSSKASQLFSSISGISQAPSQQNNVFNLTAPETTTPSGSPLKAPAANKPATTTAQLGMPIAAPTGPVNFFAQFAKNSEKDEAEAAKKRKDEEFDSEDDDPEEWAKADKERAEKKKAELAEAAKKAPSFVFNPSGTPSRTPSPFKTNNEASVSKPPEKLLFGAMTSAKPSDGILSAAASKNTFSGFGTPAKTSETSGKPTGNPLFDRSTSTTTNLFGQSAGDFGAQDNTFKGDETTPIKFSATPSINFTASTPEKASTNGIGANLFSRSLPGSGTSLFPNKNTFSQSLAPGSVTSETSRATSPGTTGDEGGDDDAAPAEEQVNLTAATAGEEDEDVLIDVGGRGAVLGADPETKLRKWDTRGRGQIKLLCHKNTKQTRIVLRTSPAGKIVLNVNLIPNFEYKFNSAKQDSITFMVPRPGMTPPFENWALTVPKGEGAELHKLIEENKKNVTS